MANWASLIGRAFTIGGENWFERALGRTDLSAAAKAVRTSTIGRQLVGALDRVYDAAGKDVGSYGPMLRQGMAYPEAVQRELGTDLVRHQLRLQGISPTPGSPPFPTAQEITNKWGNHPLFAFNQQIFAKQNASILGTHAPDGRGIQVYNHLTGGWDPYQPRSGHYLPLQADHGRLWAIDQAIDRVDKGFQQQVEQQLQRPLTDIDIQNLDPLLGQHLVQYLDTGQPTQYLGPELTKMLAPHVNDLRDMLRTLRAHAIQPGSEWAALFGSRNPQVEGKGFSLFRATWKNQLQNARAVGQIQHHRSLPLPVQFYQTHLGQIWTSSIPRVARKLAEVTNFGLNNEVVLGRQGWLSLERDPVTYNFLHTYFRREMGIRAQNERLALREKILDPLFGVEVLSKLGLTQVRHLGRLLNSVMETDMSSTIRAMSDLKFSRQIYQDSGAMLDQIAATMGSDIGEVSYGGPWRQRGTRFLRGTGFTPADLYVRAVGAGSGYFHTETMLQRLLRNPANQFARRQLEEVGLDPDALINKWRQSGGGNLRQVFGEELSDAARRRSWSANFTARAGELPLSWSSPTGRIVTLFKSFVLKDFNLVTKKVVNEALVHGNFAPLFRVAMFGGVLGETINLLHETAVGRGSEHLQMVKEHPLQAELEAVLATGAWGAFRDLFRVIHLGDRAALELLLGPIPSDLASAFVAAGQVGVGAITGEDQLRRQGLRAAERFGLRQIPVIGTPLARALQRSQEQARRLPSGAVVSKSGKRVLGREAPGTQITAQGPSLGVLFGTEADIVQVRDQALKEIRQALRGGNRASVPGIIQRAREAGAIINANDVNRLVRELKKQAA